MLKQKKPTPEVIKALLIAFAAILYTFAGQARAEEAARPIPAWLLFFGSMRTGI